MDVAVVIPWRGGCPHRERALEWVRARYPWPVVLGEVSGEWCKARAVAAALRGVSVDVLVVADADVWCSTTPDIVEAVRAGPRWGVPHRGIRRLTEAATTRVLAGADPERFGGADLVEPPSRTHDGGGIVVLRPDAWADVPMDPRFVGWGHEDDAWGLALWTLLGPPARGRGRLWHLWHPPQQRITRKVGSTESLTLFERYRRAHNRPAAMRALLAEVEEEAA